MTNTVTAWIDANVNIAVVKTQGYDLEINLCDAGNLRSADLGTVVYRAINPSWIWWTAVVGHQDHPCRHRLPCRLAQPLLCRNGRPRRWLLQALDEYKDRPVGRNGGTSHA